MSRIVLFCFLWMIAFTPAFSQSSAWEEQNDFVNGYARVFHAGKFSFVNNSQQLISPFVFEDARNFYNHLAAVKQKDKWGFVNESGKLIIPFVYDIVFDYREPVTVALKSNTWWLINRQGGVIRQLDISVCYGFQNGTAIVYKNGLKGHMDKSGAIRYEDRAPVLKKYEVPYIPSVVNSVCPANLDFEYGNFTNWQCFTGRVDSVGNTNVITVTPSPPTPGRHTMYARAIPSALDPFGLFPTNPPDGSTYAVRLGNTNVNAQAERIRYVIHVPLNDSDFSFRYHYAVVLQDPGHTSWTQPRFTAKLFDSTSNAYINCASFEYISTSGLPGFIRSTVDTSVIYKTWSAVFISLRGYAGKTLYLDFTTADCVRKAHWGYAYVDVENTCGQAIQAQYNCDTPHVTTLTGPPGFQFYNWWNQNFSTLLGTGQTVTLNPGPPPNSLIWLEMIPFANFGCIDTLPVRVTGVINAHFDATDTLGICAPHGFTFYNRNLPSSVASWDFGDGNTGTGDTVTHVYNLPGTYIVTMWVTQAGGCTGMVKDTVRVVQPTGTFAYTGGSYCDTHTVLFTATVNYIDSLFWDFGDGTYLNTTQTTVSHTYAQPGIYVPHLVVKSNFGCQLILPGPDTIRIEKLRPGYTNNILQSCTFSTITLTDTSYSFFGISSRFWDFGDGTTVTGTTVTHTYTTTGTYAIKLVITGVTGCKDSTIKNIYIKVNNRPVSSISGDTAACMNATVIFSGAVVSVDAINIMNWTCSNGASGTGNNFPVTFSTVGIYTVQWITGTVFGCYDTVIHTIHINPLPAAAISSPATVCLNAPPPVITFTGSGGTAPYTFTYTINGGPNLTVTTTSGNTATINAPTNTAGTYTYALVKVQDASSTLCSQLQSGSVLITINPLPTASISAPATVCVNAPSPLVTFTGASATAPYTFTYTINGGPELTVTTVSGNSVTVAAPTNAAGTFTYALVRVQDGSSTACVQPQSGNVLITVNPLPAAAISGTAEVCLNASPPLVTFTGAGATAPYTFTYRINGGPLLTVTSTSGNTATVAVPTNIAGTFTYSLVSVQDGSSTACSQAQAGTAQVKVNPLPAALINGPATVCVNAASPLVTFTGSGGTAPYTFTYTINNGPNLTVTSTSGNTATVAAPTNIAGTFIYALVSVQDGSSTACNQPQAGNVLITINPLPTAAITAPAGVCLHGPSPLVTFTGAAGTAPYTFTYRINSGPNLTITTTSGNSATVAAPTNIAGTFVYTLISVQDASSTACSRLQAGIANVVIHPLPPVDAGANKILCQGSSVQLNATGAAQYNWSPATGLSCTNCASPVADPRDTIQYIVQGTSSFGCVAADSISIFLIKPFPMQASPDDTLCLGEVVQLKASGANHYLWTPSTGLNHDDIASPMANPASDITYRVVGYDGYSCFSDTSYIKITVGPWPTVNMGTDLTLATGDVVTLNTTVQNGPIIKWVWEPATDLSCSNCAAPRLTVHDNISYIVTVTNRFNCVARDAINIFTFCKTAQVFIPNAFTPDGDGLNDVLMVRGKGIHVNYFRVFSRWGELVFEKKDFEPNDPKYGWDGKIRGIPASPDVFVYTAEVICDNSVMHVYKGNTSLLK